MEEAKAAAYYDGLTRRGEGAARFKQASASLRQTRIPKMPLSAAQRCRIPPRLPSSVSLLRRPARRRSRSFRSKHRLNPYRTSSRGRRPTRRRKERMGNRLGFRRERIGIRGSGAGAEAGAERGIRGGEVGAERGIEKEIGMGIGIGIERGGGGGLRAIPMEVDDGDAEKDTTKGMGSGWERFEFSKDAPLDDEDVEVAEGDAALVKQIGQSFRFSAVETKREKQLRSAHNEAMFGASDDRPTIVMDSDIEAENDINDSKESEPTTTSLLSDKVLSKKQGSWCDWKGR